MAKIPQISNFSLINGVLVALVYIASRLRGLTTSGLWLDECFSLQAVAGTWRELFQIVGADLVHPPLFYVLLKVWTGFFGVSLVALKSFPFVCAVLTLPFLAMLAREIRLSATEKSVFLTLFALNPFLIFYAQEVRMYALFVLLTAISLWLAARSAQRDYSFRTLAFFTAINILLVYTHYFAWLLIFCEVVVLCFARREIFRRVALSFAVPILAFVPWALFVADFWARRPTLQNNLAWLDKPSVRSIFDFLTKLHGEILLPRSVLISTIIFGGLLALGTALSRRRTFLRKVLLSVLFVALTPALTTFFISVFSSRSIFSERYLIFVAVPYLLALTISAGISARKISSFAPFLLIALWSATAFVFDVRNPSRNNWRQIGATLESSASKTVYAFEDWTFVPLENLKRYDSSKSLEVFRAENAENGEFSVKHRDFWTVSRRDNLTPNALFAESSVPSSCRASEEIIFPNRSQDIRAVRYSCR